VKNVPVVPAVLDKGHQRKLRAAINAALYDKLNFNVLRDIAPVASLARAPNVLEVNLAVPARTVPELIAYAKANPGKLIMASSVIGGSPHLSGELFKMMAGVNTLHVPYRGALAAMAGMMAGEAQVFFDNLPSSIEFIKAGKVRSLAVTSAMRSEALPDLPTVGEFVPGYEASPWWGVGVPKNTPAEVISTSSTRRSTRALPTPRSRRGSPIWASRCTQVRPRSSGSSS
jgi:tripartite-type tricarboxylate transporter receptor subunit TctC